MFTELLKNELIPAFGCTESAAIAYAASVATRYLSGMAEKLEIIVSGNIVKNVQGVIVPNTGGRRGIPVSVIAGMLAGPTKSELEILTTLKAEEIARIDGLLEETDIRVEVKDISGLYIEIQAQH